MKEIIIEAILNKKLLNIVYTDKDRVIEPWLIGIWNTGKLQMRAFQRAPSEDWKLFDVDKISHIELLEAVFDDQNSDRIELYNPNDKQFEEIISYI